MRSDRAGMWLGLLLIGGCLALVWADAAPGLEQAAKSSSEPPAKTADAQKKQDDEYYDLYRSLADTIDQVERNYVKDISRRELMEAAIKGVLNKLDPYSNYIGPDEISRFRTNVEAEFGGIGVQVTVEDGEIKITSPLVGTPAYRAGLQAGDTITKIDGKTVESLDKVDDAVRLLKGEAGSNVTLTFVHPGTRSEQTATIKREIIHVDTVLGDRRKSDDRWDFMLDAEKHIGYIRITAFGPVTAEDLGKALNDLKAQGLRALVLDLRFNPGGLLKTAVDVCNLFIDKGRIVSTKGRNTPERVWDATPAEEGKPKFDGFPIAILINGYSASASEIVAACLQDHDRAVVIGERSWGKGSVQNVIELEDGRSALKLTTASYQRPNGKNIHRFPDSKESDEWGVKPNEGFEVKLRPNEMSRLITNRTQRDVVAPHPSDAGKSDGKSSADDKTGAADKSDGGNAGGDAKSAPPRDAAKQGAPATKGQGAFVDRQLQKALSYLNEQLDKSKSG